MKPKDPIWNSFITKKKKKKKTVQGAKTVILKLVLRLKNHGQKCLGLKKTEGIAKRPLEEMTSEPETLSNDQPPLKSTVIFNEFHQIINQKAIQ